MCRERVCWIVGSSHQPRTTTQRHEYQSRGLAVVGQHSMTCRDHGRRALRPDGRWTRASAHYSSITSIDNYANRPIYRTPWHCLHSSTELDPSIRLGVTAESRHLSSDGRIFRGEGGSAALPRSPPSSLRERFRDDHQTQGRAAHRLLKIPRAHTPSDRLQRKRSTVAFANTASSQRRSAQAIDKQKPRSQATQRGARQKRAAYRSGGRRHQRVIKNDYANMYIATIDKARAQRPARRQRVRRATRRREQTATARKNICAQDHGEHCGEQRVRTNVQNYKRTKEY